MSSKNRIKQYAPDSYYHVYNRGVNKKVIFNTPKDYAVFLNILKRHLGSEVQKDSSGRPYDKFGDSIELLAFCLMPNHFHMYVYQSEDDRAIELFMRKVITAYVMYYNRKHNRIGPLFQDRYKASLIDNEAYFQHISRYIHRNPMNYRDYEWSSLPYYLGNRQADWVKPAKIMGLFENPYDYSIFLDDIDDVFDSEDIVKVYLADQ
jgi:putative transposase